MKLIRIIKRKYLYIKSKIVVFFRNIKRKRDLSLQNKILTQENLNLKREVEKLNEEKKLLLEKMDISSDDLKTMIKHEESVNDLVSMLNLFKGSYSGIL